MTTEDTIEPFYTDVIAPAYANAEKTQVRCFVKFAALPAPVPFVATATDIEAHGAEIFSTLVAGDHGPIAPYAPALMADTQVALSGAVQAHLDATARGLGYDSIASAVTYADEPSVPVFQAQGRAFRAWRSQVWQACIATLASVKDGSLPVPSAEALIASLPAFVAP